MPRGFLPLRRRRRRSRLRPSGTGRGSSATRAYGSGARGRGYRIRTSSGTSFLHLGAVSQRSRARQVAFAERLEKPEEIQLPVARQVERYRAGQAVELRPGRLERRAELFFFAHSSSTVRNFSRKSRFFENTGAAMLSVFVLTVPWRNPRS